MFQFLFSPAFAIPLCESFRERFINVSSIFSTLVVQDVFLDAFANAPIHLDSLGISVGRKPLSGRVNDQAHVIKQRLLLPCGGRIGYGGGLLFYFHHQNLFTQYLIL